MVNQSLSCQIILLPKRFGLELSCTCVLAHTVDNKFMLLRHTFRELLHVWRSKRAVGIYIKQHTLSSMRIHDNSL